MPRRAGLSAFGATGSNVHLVVEEYVAPQRIRSGAAERGAVAQPVLIPVSALTPERLQAVMIRLRDALSRPDGGDDRPALQDIAYTLQVGRLPLPARRAFVVRTLKDLLDALDKAIGEETAIPGLDGSAAEGEAPAPADPATLDAWFRAGRLEDVALHWMRGGDVPWNSVARAGDPRRVSLPAYPFAGDRHWIGGTGQEPDRPLDPVAFQIATVPVWREQPVRPGGPDRGALGSVARGGGPGRILVMAPDSARPLVAAIADLCRQRRPDALVWRVRLDPPSSPSGPRSDAGGDWEAATGQDGWVDRVLAAAGPLDAIYVIAAAGGEAAPPASPGDPFVETRLLALVNAVRDRAGAIADRTDLYLVTGDRPGAGGSGLPGLGYFLAQDDPRFQVRSLEIAFGAGRPAGDMAALAQAIDDEPPSDRGEVVRLDGGRRYGRVFRPLAPQTPPGEGFRKGGRYVIVGGAGVVGGVVSRRLIGDFDARVAWIGRRPASDPAVSAALASFAGPGRPLYRQADVTRADQIGAAIAAVKADFGAIDGVIFAASDMRAANSPRAGLVEREFRRIFSIKAEGAIALYDAVREEPLDFLCFFSSAEAFAAAATHPAYSAAVSFADSFARDLASRAGFPVGIVNWGAWKALLAGRGANVPAAGFLDDGEAWAGLDLAVRLLRGGLASQLLCIRWPEARASGGAIPGSASAAVMAPAAPQARPAPSAAPPVAVRARTQETAAGGPASGRKAILDLMTGRLAKALRIPERQISPATSFADQGVDSIVGMAFASEIGDSLGVPLNGSILYDYPSLDQLADYLVRRGAGPAGHGHAADPSSPQPPSLQPSSPQPGPPALPARTAPSVAGGSPDPRLGALAQDLHARFLAGELSAGDVLQLLDKELETGFSA
ncbi:MAG: SDR family NAD(P)-dependent oxidoreductase [Telmatospirillum sp.]|nr:SDR family NAD(P)-dependent oxidoreductase [Telmatospirillum sp.]